MLDTPVFAPITFVNALPARCRSWLAFYDEIPVEYREEKNLRHCIRVSREEYVAAGGQPAAFDFEHNIEYRIDREFMLARIGEELLPSRLHKKDVDGLERAMYEAGKYTPHGFSGAVNLLTPIWAVARDK